MRVCVWRKAACLPGGRGALLQHEVGAAGGGGESERETQAERGGVHALLLPVRVQAGGGREGGEREREESKEIGGGGESLGKNGLLAVRWGDWEKECVFCLLRACVCVRASGGEERAGRRQRSESSARRARCVCACVRALFCVCVYVVVSGLVYTHAGAGGAARRCTAGGVGG